MNLAPMRNQPMSTGGNGNGGNGGGNGGNSQIQNEHQITQLYARIQMAVAEGYLNSQVINLADQNFWHIND